MPPTSSSQREKMVASDRAQAREERVLRIEEALIEGLDADLERAFQGPRPDHTPRQEAHADARVPEIEVGDGRVPQIELLAIAAFDGEHVSAPGECGVGVECLAAVSGTEQDERSKQEREERRFHRSLHSELTTLPPATARNRPECPMRA